MLYSVKKNRQKIISEISIKEKVGIKNPRGRI